MTTVLAVRKNGQLVMAADGQVTMANTVVKHSAKKLRRMYNDQVLAGFAGATADAFTLFERFEAKLKDYSGNVTRAAVELTKDWRTDRMLRRLEALLVVADRERLFVLSGTGDVIEPDQSTAERGSAIAVGSGGNFALSAARALIDHTELDARAIAEAAMKIASDLCIYTNSTIAYEELK
ncbi:MAG: ATP-dependent protease subunit HslV [Myxococcota bacterium]|nr:ATP-dependent protease subunit HslV [Myxococcota bacterium]